MKCPECGSDTPGDAERCASCGARLPADDAATALGLPPATPAPPDADATVLEAPHDPEATQLGVPPDPEATQLSTSPVHDPDATSLGTTPTPSLRGRTSGTRPSGTGSTGGTRVPRSYGDAAVDLVGQPLGNRYQIIRMLGAGGMGAVYQAWDQDLGVVVALKTVRPEVAADPEAARVLERRFKQELLLARKVTHKHIVRVHDMGEVDGIKYITMPYLEGDDLSKILKREGKLPVERVMPIARQVASGLAAAHAAGVVHRDLKPANIMMQDHGEALIMDFGVARSTAGQAAASGDAPAGAISAHAHGHTMVGSVVGTLEYMAPEQARAQPVDQRSDIYAFGLILYDLLLGRSRGKGSAEGVFGELQERMKEAPPSPKAKDPSIPPALDQIITRCIQPDAAARFQTTADLVHAIDRLDDHGVPIPIVRRLTWKIAAAAMVVLASLVGFTWWAAKGPAVEVAHEPVSVLIADFQNGTGDATFERTLEPVMQIALEDAAFISAFDRAGIRRTMGVRPPEKLDEQTALELAVKQGINVVLSGTVTRSGDRYELTVKAIQAVTGTVIATESERASRKEDVLGAATSLAATVRGALGDTTSDSAKRFAMEKLSAKSLDAVREYARGIEALSRSKFEEALQAFSKAVQIDPTFGTAYGGMAISARNLDRQQDALKYADQAMSNVGGMTEREQLRARGLYFYLTNDYENCVKEYGVLLAKYAADPGGRNNRALCLSHLRDLSTAVEEMRAVVKILPNRPLYRENLALYSAYNSDFAGAEQVVQETPDPGLFALMARVFAELGKGERVKARETYQAVGKIDEEGASYMASGLGDLAIHEGRFSEGARILSQGAAVDLAGKSPDKAAIKFAALAYAQLLRQQKSAAIASADKALAHSQDAKIRFLAGRIYIEAGVPAKAEKIAAELSGDLQVLSQNYGLILEGLRAMVEGNNRVAVEKLTEANTKVDTWIGHFDLGRTYLAARQYPQADSEFDRCLTRRGEAVSLFLDEWPTYGYFPLAYYYQGRVREGMRSTNFADSYKAYLEIRGGSTEDPLVPEVRKRAGG